MAPHPTPDSAEPTPEQVNNDNPRTRQAVGDLVDAVDLLILDSLGGTDV